MLGFQVVVQENKVN